MGVENIPRANHKVGMPTAPCAPEQPLDAVPGSGRGSGKDTPMADGEGDIPTTMACWLCSL